MTVERSFRRDIGALDELFTFVDSFLSGQPPVREVRFNVCLIVEELFTNMVRHADGQGEIAVRLGLRNRDIEIRLTDFGVSPWDPTRAEPFDVEQPLESRGPGGMGLHLVRQLARSFTYEHHDGNSIVTVLTGAHADA